VRMGASRGGQSVFKTGAGRGILKHGAGRNPFKD
jgi:hypothetical protein